MARKKVVDELLDHDYDGIQELDNDLPPWWLYLFYFSIIWAVGYMLYYHVFDIGNSQIQAYEQEMKAAKLKYSSASGQTPAGETAPAADLTPYTDRENLAAGKTVYQSNCVPCHGQAGEGGIGPNVTDPYWIHGGSMNEVVHIINVGVPAKGMISWKAVLKPEQIKQVASFILSLQGTNPPNAKAPEGKKVE